jgi:hypothetical protein
VLLSRVGDEWKLADFTSQSALQTRFMHLATPHGRAGAEGIDSSGGSGRRAAAILVDHLATPATPSTPTRPEDQGEQDADANRFGEGRALSGAIFTSV